MSLARQALTRGGRALRLMRSSSRRALAGLAVATWRTRRALAGLAVATWRTRRRVHLAAAAYLLLAAGAMVSGLWVGGLRQPRIQGPGVATHERSAAPGPAATATPPQARLLIPAIGVDAAVESVGTDAAGNMAPPSAPESVGWYRYGPAPGDPGDAVIDGHLDWTSGPAVFWRLDQLKPGDGIVVEIPGRGTTRFQVGGLTVVPYTAHPPGLFATSGPPRLSLITCAGSFDGLRGTYLQRLIVDAGLVAAETDRTRPA